MITNRDIVSDMFDRLWEASRLAGPSPYIDSAARFLSYALRRRDESRGQLFQDLLALFALGEKRDGYFVEIGAGDGVELSNTYVLEAAYGWRGILAEPARVWHPKLRENRAAAVDTRYVWSDTGKSIDFAEATHPELSTALNLAATDHFNAADRVFTDRRYAVETVSLNDLLAEHKAPDEIDYLSVDTEGSETQILAAFDFSQRRVNVITVEHNYRSPDREQILGLLASHGYVRVFDMLSAWDDWYVHRSALKG